MEKNKLYPKSRASRKAKRTCRFMQQPGAGRKADFPDLLPALKQWHETERQHGHSVSKPVLDSLGAERPGRLCFKKHNSCLMKRDRKSKLLASKKYRHSFTDRLVAEQVTHLSLPARRRCALS